MGKKVKILLVSLLFLIAVGFLLHFQTKRIVIQLIESATSNKVQVNIEHLTIIPISNSITVKDVVVLNKEESGGFKKVTVKKAFLDVASLLNFLFGGTLVIEKLECEGGEITLQPADSSKKNSSGKTKFEVNKLIKRVKSTSVRFQVQDLLVKDFNLTILPGREQLQAPTLIKHAQIRVSDLYLNADSVLKKKPLVEFSLPKQTIRFSDALSIDFDSLFFSTTDNSIQINSLALQGSGNGRNTYSLRTDIARVAYFDFESFYRKGVVVIDSVFLGQSFLSALWEVKPATNQAKVNAGISSIPELRIRQLNVKQLAADVKLYQDSLANTFSIENSSLSMEDFLHAPDSSRKVSVRNFDLVLANYTTFLSKKHTAIKFDTIRVKKNELYLLNFKLYANDQRTPLLQTAFFELRQVDWYSLLVYRRLNADRAVITSPLIHTTIQPGGSHASDRLVAIKSLRDFLEVDLLSIKNGTAYVNLVKQKGNLTLKGMNTTIKVDELIDSENINASIAAIETYSFESLKFISPEIQGTIKNLNLVKGRTAVEELDFRMRDKVDFSVNRIFWNDFYWDEPRQELLLSGLSWKQLNAIMQGSAQEKLPKDSSSAKLSIRLSKVRGENSTLSYMNTEVQLSTLLKQLNVESLQLSDTLFINGLAIKGEAMSLQNGKLKISIGNYSLSDAGGEFGIVQLNSIDKDTIITHIDKIVFKADMQALARKKIYVNELNFRKMNTSFKRNENDQNFDITIENDLSLGGINYTKEGFTIKSILLETGPFRFLHKQKVSKREETIAPSAKAKSAQFRLGIDTLFNLTDSVTSTSLHKIRAIEDKDPSLAKLLFTVDTTRIQSENGVIVKISDVMTFKVDSATHFRANVNFIKPDQVSIQTNKTNAQVTRGSINDLTINSTIFKDPWEMLEHNLKTASIHQLQSRVETAGNYFKFDRFDYEPKEAQGLIQGFEFRPIKERKVFLEESFYQTNYMHAKIDTISIQKLNISKADSAIRIRSIQVESPSLEISRDKTHPFYSKNIKLLPTNAFKKIGLGFSIDTLQLKNGKILYIEKSRVTGQEGFLSFNNLNGLVRNVKNIDLNIGDSLYIGAKARFLDSATLKLRVKESYHDSLAGFVMTTQVSPFHASILNPALIPLVDVKFTSGFIDTMQMRAVGREYLSLGSMKFFYHDLKVDFLNKNDTSKHSAKNVLLKFAANNFVIKENNTNRIGTVFFERDRRRAVFQYWVKMLLSGVTTSIGAKSNKKLIKKYKQDLNQRGLPAIDKELTDF